MKTVILTVKLNFDVEPDSKEAKVILDRLPEAIYSEDNGDEEWIESVEAKLEK